MELHARALFTRSVDDVDLRVRSRLNRARQAALAAAGTAQRRPLVHGFGRWAPAVGFAAALALGVTLWIGSPLRHPVTAGVDAGPTLDDLEIVAASDGTVGDTLDMLQDDIEFYDWAEHAASTGPAA